MVERFAPGFISVRKFHEGDLALVVFTTEKELIGKVKTAILATIDPAIAQFVAPHLSKLVDILAYPVSTDVTICPS